VDNIVPNWSKLFSTVTVSPELAKLDNTQLLNNYSGPLMIIVVEDNSITPVKFSQNLYEATGSSVKIYSLF